MHHIFYVLIIRIPVLPWVKLGNVQKPALAWFDRHFLSVVLLPFFTLCCYTSGQIPSWSGNFLRTIYLTFIYLSCLSFPTVWIIFLSMTKDFWPESFVFSHIKTWFKGPSTKDIRQMGKGFEISDEEWFVKNRRPKIAKNEILELIS